METGIVIKPPASSVASGHAQPAIGAGIKAAPTVLPAAQTVRPARELNAPRNDLASQNPTKNQVVIDPQSRDVIFQVIDVRSRRVVRQFPDEALVRLRAYTRTLASGKPAPSPSKRGTDREI